MPDEFLTITDLAARLRVRERVVQHYIDTGALPSRKIGKAVRIRAKDIDTWWEGLPGNHVLKGPINGRPENFPVTQPVAKGIPTVPDDPSVPALTLVRGAKGKHRAEG